ncbi:MAG TPA: nucleotidyl transferase AbiEii/AbiGii toxin family protein [Microthrixaceae bacterium]|nr:nucleotidyl transferase AbiEii/AbiGii toxin family protein [Microthrixaceae bacterium]
MTSVVLSGRKGGTTHSEVALLASLPPELRLIGGLAVMCRVGSPHRTTVDLDAVARDLDGLHESLAGLAVTAQGGGQYRFAGDMDLDVIEVSPDPTADLVDALEADGEPITDLELNIVALTWAHDDATALDVVAVDELNGEPLVTAAGRLVASTSGLVAMKTSAIPLRASTRPEKRASDFYDLARLLLVDGPSKASLAGMPSLLATTVASRLNAWFVDDAGRDRVFREIRRFDEPAANLDDVADAVEDLLG